jgi:hypothetical protein
MSVGNRWIKCLGIGALGLMSVGVASLHAVPADARVLFDVGIPTYVAPPPYYSYASPAKYAPYFGHPAVAGAIFVGFGGYHWQ